MALRRLERLAARANQAGGSMRLSFELHPRLQTQPHGRCAFAFCFFASLRFLFCWCLAALLPLPLLCRAVLRNVLRCPLPPR